jgi:transposase-like protein
MKEKNPNKSFETTFSKKNYIEHSPEFRQEIVESAFKIGVTETARSYNITRGFINTWKKRFKAGMGFDNQGKRPPLDAEEKKNIVNLALSSHIYNPKKLKELFSLNYSLDTIHRVLVQGNLLLQRPFLLHYRCEHCKNNLNVIQIYYGRLLKPPCPDCFKSLNYITRWQLPFYNPSKKDYYISQGKLLQAEGSEFTRNVLPYLEIDADLSALCLIHPNPRPKYKFHVIKVFHNNTPITFCGEKYTFNRPHKIVSASEGIVTNEKLCRLCQSRTIKTYDQKKHLDPTYSFSKKTKQQRDLEVIWDYFIYRQVKIVSHIHNIHPSTFYEIKKRNNKIYATFEQLHNKWMN